SVGGQTNPDSPLSDVDVRRALAMAIDRQGIVDSLLGGEGEPAYLFSFPASVGFPEDADDLVWEYDLDAAAELLGGAGYGDGFPLELVVPTVGRELAGAVAQGWRELGVDVTVSVVEQAEALSDMQSDARKQETRIIMVWGPNGIPFRSEISGSMATHLNGGETHSQPLASSTVPDLVAAQAAEVDPEARREILAELLTTAFEEVDVIPTWYVNSLYGVGPRVGTWEVPSGATYLTGMDTLELAE
ncbi:MAG TPA: ABC transporter substrate-binding protein, partial [Iamia sp.]|nr:ABC transporter substrate-binding protein [Iamia sp.]